MASNPLQPVSFDAKSHQCELDAERLALEPPRVNLVDADPMLLGMRMGNILYAAAFGLLRRVGERSRVRHV